MIKIDDGLPLFSPESTQKAPFRPAASSKGMCFARLLRTLGINMVTRSIKHGNERAFFLGMFVARIIAPAVPPTALTSPYLPPVPQTAREACISNPDKKRKTAKRGVTKQEGMHA